MQTLLVPTDFSQSAEYALARALQLPLGPSASLTVLHVIDDDAKRRDAEDAVVEFARPTRAAVGLRTRVHVSTGDTCEQIIGCTHAQQAELIVMGRHKHRTMRDWLRGSTADRTLRQTDVPVLVVSSEPHGPYRRPIIATDVVESAGRLAASAAQVLQEDVHQIYLVHTHRGQAQHSSSRRELERAVAAESDDVMQALLRSLGSLRDRCLPTVRGGDSGTVILEEIERHRADLVVLGTQGRGGLSRVVHEHVAEYVMDHALCDVLIVPPRLSYAAERATRGAAASADSHR